jgi:hypothetical protein
MQIYASILQSKDNAESWLLSNSQARSLNTDADNKGDQDIAGDINTLVRIKILSCEKKLV